MLRQKLIGLSLAASFVATPMIVGCDSLPGNKEGQGAVIGGAGGAAAGALIAKNNRLLGGLIGGALGAGGGYLVGAQIKKNDQKHKDEAYQASDNARTNPAKPGQVDTSPGSTQTADLNNDGFVTLDEVVAMRQAGLSDQEMLRRLNATQQVFDLNSAQQQYLAQNGVDQSVINGMLTMNRPQAVPAAATYPPQNGSSIGNQPVGQPTQNQTYPQPAPNGYPSAQ